MPHRIEEIHDWFVEGFRQAVGDEDAFERRIGAELKFPLTSTDGSAAPPEAVDALWAFLADRGWTPESDAVSGKTVGATTPGERNETVASCETGYCKPEFSLAHAGDIAGLEAAFASLRETLHDFSDKEGVRFLAYGIQPVTPPSQALLMKKSRTSVWDKACPSNTVIPPEQGDDFHMFTVNAASHVHVSVRMQEAMPAVNVLNGFAPAQLALTAHSNIWKGARSAEYKCVADKLWDWWPPAAGRCGVTPKPFASFEEYVQTVQGFRPIYVKRDGLPVVLEDYESFADYFTAPEARGRDLEGRPVTLVPASEDIGLHNSCYWFNARVSRYYTVENRTCDQQPPEAILSLAALTLGLVEHLDAAWSVLAEFDWADLRQARERALRTGLDPDGGAIDLGALARRMLDVARQGLERRKRGEERFLEPLCARVDTGRVPADETADLFEQGGIPALVAARAL